MVEHEARIPSVDLESIIEHTGTREGFWYE
jgi:hypothetical protein